MSEQENTLLPAFKMSIGPGQPYRESVDGKWGIGRHEDRYNLRRVYVVKEFAVYKVHETAAPRLNRNHKPVVSRHEFLGAFDTMRDAKTFLADYIEREVVA